MTIFWSEYNCSTGKLWMKNTTKLHKAALSLEVNYSLKLWTVLTEHEIKRNIENPRFGSRFFVPANTLNIRQDVGHLKKLVSRFLLPFSFRRTNNTLCSRMWQYLFPSSVWIFSSWYVQCTRLPVFVAYRKINDCWIIDACGVKVFNYGLWTANVPFAHDNSQLQLMSNTFGLFKFLRSRFTHIDFKLQFVVSIRATGAAQGKLKKYSRPMLSNPNTYILCIMYLYNIYAYSFWYFFGHHVFHCHFATRHAILSIYGCVSGRKKKKRSKIKCVPSGRINGIKWWFREFHNRVAQR